MIVFHLFLVIWNKYHWYSTMVYDVIAHTRYQGTKYSAEFPAANHNIGSVFLFGERANSVSHVVLMLNVDRRIEL